MDLGVAFYCRLPYVIDSFPIDVEEWMYYQYMPIKLTGGYKPTFEKRLDIFSPIIGAACCDYIGRRGLDDYINTYVYITVKNKYQTLDCPSNRAGWHSDGFMTNDLNYIWYNKQPTIFNNGDFYLTQDDAISMKEMEEQANPRNNIEYPSFNLIRMDQYSIHRVGDPIEGERCFVKISFSKDKYNLKGNTKNHELHYNWEMKERKVERNIPQCKEN